MATDPEFVIVDSSVWIDYLNDQNNAQTVWLDANLTHGEIGLTDLILGEVLQGYKSEAAQKEILKSLTRFHIFSAGGASFAARAADNYRRLRQRDLTVRTTIDCWTASFCIAEGYALLHRDRDFDAFERHLGLKVVHAPALRVH